MEQIIFITLLIITLAVFSWSAYRIYRFFRLTRAAYPVKEIGKRFRITIINAIFQERIFRNRIAGIMHALVFWGFCVILLGSIEMVVDGVAGTDRLLSFQGPVYDVIMAVGDVFAYVIALFIVVFIVRRSILSIPRLHGRELTFMNHTDAFVALSFILILMLTLAGMNIFYVAEHPQGYEGYYPISELFAPIYANANPVLVRWLHDVFWWSHILLIFLFANILPYSKHFHIFMSIPNVFFSRISPLGKMYTMEDITHEVKLMMDPATAFAAAPSDQPPARFGILDIEDVTWKNYIDSLACTQCGRCTSVCPAATTGKALSPRKMMMDIRRRMKDKGPKLVKHGKEYSDQKSLIRDYIAEEEIWACTTCNACARECPINIDQPTFILDLRRYLVMEESKAPAPLNTMFSYIENNGAPWQVSQQDRMKWSE